MMNGRMHSSKNEDQFEKLELRILLTNLKKSIEMFFLSDMQWSSGSEVISACTDVLCHGLIILKQEERNLTDKQNSQRTADVLNKLVDDFKYLQRTTHVGDSLNENCFNCFELENALQLNLNLSVQEFFQTWLTDNLQKLSLCAALQSLVEDKELLHFYYGPQAFLANDLYATALFICLSSLELKQFSLLSQINEDLYAFNSTTHPLNIVNNTQTKLTKHRRSTSHPIFSISPPKKSVVTQKFACSEHKKTTEYSEVDGQTSKKISNQKLPPLNAFRKVKSLPLIPTMTEDCCNFMRPRCRTLHSSMRKALKTKRIPIVTISKKDMSTRQQDFIEASTSAGSNKPNQQNLNDSSSNSTGSVKSNQSLSSNQHFEIIKCEDIKIWTDQSCDHLTPKRTTNCTIPNSSLKTKSISPLNSFLSSIFGSSPTQNTSWYVTSPQTDSSSSQHSSTEAGSINLPSYPYNLSAQSSVGIFDSFLFPVEGKKLRHPKSQTFFEDGFSSCDYTATSAVANVVNSSLEETSSDVSAVDNTLNASSEEIPNNCQSLTAFLQKSQLFRNNTELEKENAHFLISEAIISAIEHIKWAKTEPDKWKEPKGAKATDWLEKEEKPKCLQPTTSSAVIEEHLQIPYAEVGKNCLVSAEVVGLSIISKFNDNQLPKVSELKWLVSEEDTPQQMLPMPNQDLSKNPDEHFTPSVTRGTRYWAPPRQQIIFTDHPVPNRKDQLQKQNNRCAGCGMRVSPQYINSFRYCCYFGKYHCTGCHRNQISVIPAKILQMWDFKCYPVSVFAYRLLEQMYTYPLFYVPDLSPQLYIHSKSLLQAREKRFQLKYVEIFIKACRFAVVEQTYFASIPEHIYDPDMWSISDFVDANSKCLQQFITDLINKCEKHILTCELCNARGFLCERCRKSDVIFPWQSKTFRCDTCGGCFHLNCWKSLQEICCRCQRIKKRKITSKE